MIISQLNAARKGGTFRDRSIAVLMFLLISRLLTMFLMPLNDSTEARYGEIARIMLETGNWVTPMQGYGIPFWAKPPLSTWLSAFSMKLFGVNEVAARLPSLLLSIGIIWLVWDLAKKRSGSQVAMMAVLILAGCISFYLNAGTVMTDAALIFCTTLSLIAFWHAVVMNSKVWGYLFFVGLGLGLLAKGPVALVLTGLPIFFWVLRHKQRWIALWQRIPWITGMILMVLIAGPWYALAEMKTPGFINYFIVGENFHRFLDPGWSGDKYGFAHKEPMGMIWVYAFLAIFPWSIIGIAWLVHHAKSLPSFCKDNDGWGSYLLLCTLVPLGFFTFSSNIIFPYVFPSLPAFALFFAEIAGRSIVTPNVKSLDPTDKPHDVIILENRLIGFATLSGIIFLIVSAIFVFKPELIAKSQYQVIQAYKNQATSLNNKVIYWYPKVDFSAQFYSAGKVVSTLDPDELRQWILNGTGDYVVTNLTRCPLIPKDVLKNLKEIAIIQVLKNEYALYRYTGPNQHASQK